MTLWRFAACCCLLFVLIGCTSRTPKPPNPPLHYDVVIYGGGLAAYGAIEVLQRAAPQMSILVVVPEDRLGEAATGSGNNLWSGEIEGFGRLAFDLYRVQGRCYDPWRLSNKLSIEFRKHRSVTVWMMRDIASAEVEGDTIQRIVVKRLYNDNASVARFSGEKSMPATVEARAFIDVRRKERLTRFAHTQIEGLLDARYGFVVSGIDVQDAERSGEFKVSRDEDGSTILELKRPFVVDSVSERNLGVDITRVRISEIWGGTYMVSGPALRSVDPSKERKDGRAGALTGIDHAMTFLRSIVTSTEYQDAFGALPGMGQFRIRELPPYVSLSSPRPHPKSAMATVQEVWTEHHRGPGPKNLIDGLVSDLPSPSGEEIVSGMAAGAWAYERALGDLEISTKPTTQALQLLSSFGLKLDTESKD